MQPALRNRLRANARNLFSRVWKESFATKRKRKPSQWATDERRFEIGQSPLSGQHVIRYSHSVMPWCVEPMDASDDPSVNIIALWFHRRGGKTESICCNNIGRIVTDEPGNILDFWPAKEGAEKFSRDTLNPMIGATPCLNSRFFEAKSRDAGRTKFYLRFAGGSVYIGFAGSGSATRSVAARAIFLHEVDHEAYGNQVQGDIIEKALGRGEGFGDAIKFIESTGTFTSTTDESGKVKYRSRIAYWHDLGDKRKWFCPCRKCGQLQWLKFDQIKTLRGMERAYYLCERCDTDHSESQWARMVREGKWFPTAGLTTAQLLAIEANAIHAHAKDPVVRSYWINGFNSLLPKGKGYATKLHQFVAEAARAKEKPATEQVWVNEVDTTLWNPDTSLEPPPEWKPLFDRREDYATEERITLPDKALVLTVGADIHPNRIEASWVAWGREEQAWVIDHVVIDGDIRQWEVWRKFKLELQRRFTREDGVSVGLDYCLVDAGYGAEQVLGFLRTQPAAGKIRACRGTNKFPYPIINRHYSRGLSGDLSGHWVGGDAAKDLIYTRIRLECPDTGILPTGYIHFGLNLGQIYFEQLCSERVTVDEDEGRHYNNTEHARNESLDTFVYALAAFRRRIWNFTMIEKELAEQAAALRKPEAKPVAQSSGFKGKGWRL